MHGSSDLAAAGPRTNSLFYASPADEPVKYSVTCYPAMENGKIWDWNLGRLNEPGFLAHLREYVSPEVRDLYAPTVSAMSGELLPPERFTRRFDHGRHLHVYRPGYLNGSSANLQRCDGTLIKRRSAFLMSAAGCALIVLTGVTPDGIRICLMAHAGSESLLDKQLIIFGEKSRDHFSIVDAMVAHALALGLRMEDMTLRAFFALQWEVYEHSLSHPDYGLANRFLADHFERHPYFACAMKERNNSLFLCMSTLIRKQARIYPLRLVEVDEHYSLPINREYASTTHTHPALAGTVRNGVIGIQH